MTSGAGGGPSAEGQEWRRCCGVSIEPEAGIKAIGLRDTLAIAMEKRNEDNEAGVGGHRQAADGGGLYRLAQDERCRWPQAHRIEKHDRKYGESSVCLSISRIARSWTDG